MTTATETPTPTFPTASPGGIDLTAVKSEPRTPFVATTLDTYFKGVNAHNAAMALSVFDPSGQINPNDPAQVSSFQTNIATSHDDQIAITHIRDDPTAPGGSLVDVTFRSQQQAQYGPDGETCTKWRLTYDMTATFKILGSTASHNAC